MITLEEIVGYLPYGLKSVAYFDNNRLIRDVTLHNVMAFINDEINAKVLLRPISDLTKEELRKQGFTSHIDYLTHEQFCDQKEKFPILNAPFEMIQYLFKNNYDVFGLIERGDAIDINSLT